MGLSASQAKLLSITSRLSSIELRSQQITRQKTELSDQTIAASEKYLESLNSTNLTYLTYDLDGNKTYTELTGSQLTSYAPLKNQYGLINSSGQILVSETDAANYEDSDNINEFLSKYGIDPIETNTTTITNPAYTAALDDYNQKYEAWKASEPAKEIKTGERQIGEKVIQEAYDEVVSESWTERVHTSEVYQQVLKTGCMSHSVDNLNCYMHVIASLIGEGEHTTSDGNTYTIYNGDCQDEHHINNDGSESNRKWCWTTDQHPITEELLDALKNTYPCGEEHDETVDLNYEGTIYRVPCKNSDCDETQTVYQKLVDLLWEVHDDYSLGSGTGGAASTDHISQFWHIIEFDLDEATIVEHPAEIIHHEALTEPIMEDVYETNPEYEKWLEKEPQMEDVPETLEETTYKYSNNDEAQWYVNLWHRMNGESDEKDGTVANAVGNDTSTKKVGRRWDILEDGLMNNSKWLQYSLEKGTITLERVDFSDETDESTGLKNAEWNATIYTNALDISEATEDDQTAKAEAEFEQTQKVLEAKDKQYDNMLKLLDTEHEALQTEYESVKSVIDKNIDNTLKIYQA